MYTHTLNTTDKKNKKQKQNKTKKSKTNPKSRLYNTLSPSAGKTNMTSAT